METETVSSRNIVDLLLKEEFNASICGTHNLDSDLKHNTTHTSEATLTGKQDEDNYVYGWDC
jgi:prenylcysteine oxidase/farnesylcysteine lyase